MLFKFFNDVLFDCILNYFVVGCCKYSVWKHASNTGGPWMTTTQVTYPKKMYATEKQHEAKPQRILFIKDIIINFYFPQELLPLVCVTLVLQAQCRGLFSRFYCEHSF